MNKKLAIKGHPTRGKEVIELLEMMGGNNRWNASGELPNLYYFISNGCIIYSPQIEKDAVIFTLEKFLEKYPFKVGDKVEVCGTNNVFTIGNMMWDDELYIVHYANMEDFEYYTTKELKLYKETNKNENKCTRCVYAVNNNHCGLRGFRSNFNVNYCSAQNIDKLPNGFELQEDGYFSWVNKKPEYPKTFEECLNMLYCKSILRTIIGHKAELLLNLEKLLICRDAYWKIAGEEMGLGKPWESPLPSLFETVYCIRRKNNEIIKGAYRGGKSEILEFPTKEMRDVFYENFKDLIESCKELL